MILLLVGLMLLPMVASTRVEITHNVAGSFVGNIGLSLVVTLLIFGLFPPLPSEPTLEPRAVLPAAEVDRRAWILTALTGSYAVAYFSFGWTNVHTPIDIAIYAYSANLARGLTVTKGILAANIAGGSPDAGDVSAHPDDTPLSVRGDAGADGQSGPRPPDRVRRPLGTAGRICFERSEILYGESLIPFSDNGGANFGDRLGELGMAAIHAVGGLYDLDAYFPPREPDTEKAQGSLASEPQPGGGPLEKC